MRKLLALITLVVFILAASPCWAAIPHQINYQGMLTDTDGTPLDGNYDLGFKIYGSESGDDSLWWEHHSDVQVTSGLFSIILGGINSLDLPFDTTYWLGIKVNDDPELTPRTQLTSVGYAYRAETADTALYAIQALAAEYDGDWIVSGSHMYTNLFGNVGIGTTDPAAKLDVVGDININSVYKIGGEAVVSAPDTGNIFVGVGTGANNTGNRGTFMGDSAGYNNQGNSNTFLGKNAGKSNTTGNANTYIGEHAGHNATGSGNVFVGYEAGYDVSGSNKLYIANGATESGVLIHGDFSSKRVGIGGTNAHSTLHNNGSLALPFKSVTPPYTATDSDCILFVPDSGTVYLPTAVGIAGRIYIIKSWNKLVTIDPYGSETIENSSSKDIRDWESRTIVSDGANWRIIGMWWGT